MMCLTKIKNDKSIKLKKLKNFSSHICKRFYIDTDLDVWFIEKKNHKSDPEQAINVLANIEDFLHDYPTSIRAILELLEFSDFIKEYKKDK